MEVTYFGRTICTDDFRAWVYGLNDTKKLMNSWEEHQEHINSGEWFASKEDLENELYKEPEIVVISKGRKKGGK